MARINRTDVIQKAVNDLAISTSADKVPTETLDKVQLTYSLNKQFSSFALSTNSASTGTMTLTMTGIPGDIYLTSISLGMIKDATCDQATGTINLALTPDGGINTNYLRIPIITLTAQTFDQIITLPYPLKIKSGTNITVTGSYTVGVMSRCLSVSGFNNSSN